MSYYSETSPTSRITGFVVVVALHVAIVYALATGLATTMVEVIKGPIQVDTLVEKMDQKDAPPPPPPQTLKPPPVFVPPPEINVAPETTNTNSTAIQAVSSAHTNPKIQSSLPEYPSSARRLKAEGKVTLVADVDERGRLSNIQVVGVDAMTVNDPVVVEDFKATALQAARSWRAKPATNGGVPVAQPGYRFTVVFKCRDASGQNNCN